MEEKKKKQREPKEPRQSWAPHWLLRVLHAFWTVAYTTLKVALGAVATVLCIVVICTLVFSSILGDYLQQDIIPSARVDLDDYEMELTSFIWYGNTGNIRQLQQIYATNDRQWAYFDEIPEPLVKAAIAIEDKRFYEHQGVDWITTVKACANIFFGGGDLAGGSTITQQVVKNATGEDSITVQRKVLEIFRALQVEKDYDKDFIMEFYLNKIYLGQGAYGVKAASAAYFGKELEDLTIAECASLISITNNPSIFDPYGEEFEYAGKMTTGAERNRMRQEIVLEQMLAQNLITKAEYDEAIAQKMVFKYGISDEDKNFSCSNDSCDYRGKVGSYVKKGDKYFCPVCGNEVPIDLGKSEEVYSWMVDTILEDVARDMAARDGHPWNDDTREDYMMRIQRGGYNIYSTIDVDVQEHVDSIYEDLEHLPEARSKQQLQSAIVLIDNRTGDIVAMSGGVGKKKDFDAYNRATDAELQTGSSIKPLSVYAPAFEMGAISPVSVIKDMPLNYDDGAWPLNDMRRYDYAMTILSGVTSSINAVAVNTLDIIGPEYSFDFAKNKFGLSTLVDSYVRDDGYEMTDVNYAALALGAQTFGCTVRDMATAFATFPNDGVYRKARTYTKVYDSNGNLVLDNTQESRKVLSHKSAVYTNYCLNTAANRGTGYAADFDGMPCAGKTGTTADDHDRWFCGYTPYYTAAVWTGYDTPEEINLVGDWTNPAGRLWRRVMEPLHKNLESKPLYDKSDLSYISVCKDSGKSPTDACELDVRKLYDSDFDRVSGAYAMPEDRPEGSCDKHVLVDYCVTGGGVATEWCHKFQDAKLDEVKIEKHALVKFTESELNEIKKASGYGLRDMYLQDYYIYLVTDSGQDAVFKGISGDLNQAVNAPYKVCPVHTKEAWEKYEASQKPTKPTLPADPSLPTLPTVPPIVLPTDPTFNPVG